MYRTSSTLPLICFLLPMSGCLPETEIGVYSAAAGNGGCVEEDCGLNTAEGLQRNIHELHLFPGQNSGLANTDGIRIVGFAAPDGSSDYTLSVEKGRFQATSDSDPSDVLSGADLNGAEIELENSNTGGGGIITIQHVGTLLTWTLPDYSIEYYVLMVQSGSNPNNVPVCSGATSAAQATARSVLLSGERYAWTTKTVIATAPDPAATGWFNISCNGNALFKMKRTGYDPAPFSNLATSTTPAQRQATYKMLTGDYCGTGFSFTATGTPLGWKNIEEWSTNREEPSETMEGEWDANGVICLDNLRLSSEYTHADVAAECGGVAPPPCLGSIGEWTTWLP